MKILLINPPSPQTTKYFSSPPLGLMYLASALRRNHNEVNMLDLFSTERGYEKIGNILQKEQFDVVGITGMSFQHHSILKTAKTVKNIDPKVPIIAGGSHVSALPELLLKNENIDFVLRGEAEQSFPTFVKKIETSNEWQDVPGLCFKKNGDIQITSPEIVKDIDSLPIPAWDLIDFKKYTGSPHGFFYEKSPIGQIITSRGCPYLCSFCGAHIIHSRHWRGHSPGRVIAEIDYLIKELRIQELHIEDDNFTFDISRAKEILARIIEKKYNLCIAFPNGIRIDRLDDELLQLMKAAGVYSITFGIESGSPRMIKRVHKKISLDFLERQIRKVRRYGFYCHGFFIIGFPYEQREDIELTIKYAKKLDLDAAFFGTYVPLPGSTDFLDLLEKKKIDINKMNWNQMFSVYVQDVSFFLTALEIKKYQKLATMRFYLRPKIILRSLMRIRGIKHLWTLIARLKSIVR